jgi:UPF0755 protein
MNYLKQYKIITAICIVIVLIGAYFLVVHFKKQKIMETQIPIATATPTQTPNTSQSSVSTATPSTTPAKPVPPPLPVGTDQFVVSLTSTPDGISTNLLGGGYITDEAAFTVLIGTKIITPGAYKISTGWTSSQLLQVLSGKPYMKWVVIPPGLRKEEIAALIGSAIGWTKKQTTEFITKDTTTKPEYIEGVYAPETYLIPVGETPALVATRLIAKFNENFSPYLPQFTAKNIKWTSALTLASIVQREAANAADMPLIAGILWNRLNQNMMLDVDSTLQYIRGNTGNGWWAPITVADKKIDSPYNTYEHTGLPPHPISNPGIAAINAVLNPTVTDCLYYLHDKNHITHCAATYAEHEANIAQYLAN